MKPTTGTPSPFKRTKERVNLAEVGRAIKAAWPTLWSYMSEERYDDGSPRQVATLLLVLDPDGLKGCLNDRAEARSLWVTGSDMDEVLDALERGLQKPDAPWRHHRKM